MAPRRPRMVNALALAASLACIFVLFTSGAAAVTLPAGFDETAVLPGVGKPQDVAIAPNGRVFVAEKTGFIRTYASVDDTTPTVFADLRTQVHNYGSRGLLSIVTDPKFGTSGNNFVYVYYTLDAPIGGTAPVYGGGSFDACPKYDDPQDGDLDKAGLQTIGQVDNCPAGSRVSRLQVAGEVMTGSEKVLVEDFCQQFTGHAGGGLGFDKDGKLIASAGDGSTSLFWDWGQSGSPANPCGDPPGGVGTALTRPTAEGGRLRAQDNRTTSDPTGLSGSVIRIDPATGAPVGTSGSDTNAKRIIAYGLRDATRLAVRPGTNDIWVTDRGGGYWEEFNRVTPSSTKVNFGWPCYENSARREQSDLQNLNLCESLYASGSKTSPHWAYDHELNVHPDDNCEALDVRSGSTLSGIEFYPVTGNFPPMYRNALFFADRLRSCIWALLPDTTGIPKRGSVVPFAGMAKRATDLEVTPTGDLLYIDQSVDQIRRIRYTPPNSVPAAVATASATSGTAPLAVTFSALGSTDADGDALTYAWDLDGDSLLDDSTAAQPAFTYTTPGTHTVTLRVTDADGAFSTATVAIKVNAVPKAVATANVTAGTAPLPVTFSGLGSTDAEGGALTYAWDLDGDTLLDDSTAAQPAFTYNTPGTHTVTLKVTDADGASSTATLVIKVNAAPNAVATASVTSGTAPLAVTFSGLGSTDADGDALTYAWDLDGDGQLDDSTAAQPAFTYTTAGSRTVTLRVTDAKGGSGTVTVVINVNAAPQAVATASVTSGTAPLAVAFSGSLSTDADGDALTYAWDLDGDGQLDDSTALQPIFNYTAPGTYTVTLKVTDTDGATSTATVPVTVTAIPNSAPHAAATASTTSGTAPLGVAFSGSTSTDPDGDPLTYAWDLDGDTLLDDSAVAQPTFGYATPGTFTVTLKVTDTKGASSTASVTIAVQAPAPDPDPTPGPGPTAVPNIALASPPAHGTVVPDKKKPFAVAAGPSRQDIDKLFVRALMSEAGTVTATGSIIIPGSASHHRFRAVTRQVAAISPVKLLPKLSSRSLKAVKRALKRRKTVKAVITLTATDQAGNTTVRMRTIRLRP